jgi:putative nucleotidyltransferase with HDIG domain
MNLGMRASLFFGATACVACIVLINSLAILLPENIDRAFFYAFIFFTLLALFGDFYEIQLTRNLGVSGGDAIFCSAVLVGGGALAIPVSFMATLAAEVLLRWHLIKQQSFSQYITRVIFNTSQMILAVAFAALIYELGGGISPLQVKESQIFPAIASFAAFTTLNVTLVGAIISLTSNRNFFSLTVMRLKHLPLQVASLGTLSILMAILWNLTPWAIALALLPMALIHFTLHNYARLRESSAKVIEKMVEMLEKRDPYTGQHSQDVANLTEDVARELKLPEEQIETIRVAAVVHDIGKIAIPESIVNKPGPLTEDEWRLMKTHTTIGADLISNLEMYGPPVVAIVRHEHEHWDGSGYPDGLKGELIPLGARIVAAADVYDALVTDRPYRKAQRKPRAYTPEQAIEIMEIMKEKTLDPKVTDACIAVIRRRIETEKEKSWSSSGRPSSGS